PAGALVVANWLIDPEMQLILADPARWGWLMTVDPTRLSAAQQAQLASYDVGVATLPAAVLAAKALPEPQGEWVAAMEKGWVEQVLQK
ncbi:MAG: ABC transporter substrate-binding protein, partial [Caldilinea sp.]